MSGARAAGFVWQAPTRVRFGTGCVAEAGRETAALGSAPAVLVDRGLHPRPVARRLLDVLTADGVPPVVVRAVGVSPTLGEVDGLLDDVLAAGADVVVGLGGGSTMDAAKLLALAATNPGLREPGAWTGSPLLDLDAATTGHRDRDLRPGLPTLLAPTTVATGSEANTVAAVRHAGRRRLVVSGHLAPATALVDPELAAILPTSALLEGAVETLARIVSPYLVPGAALELTDALAETLAARCLAAAEGLARTGAGVEELAWATTVSATQLVGLGRHRFGHALWHLQDPVCTLLEVPKGRALAALLPGYLRAVAEADLLGTALGSATRLDRLAHALAPALGAGPHGPAHPRGPGGWLADRLEATLRSWGLPTGLDQLGATPADAERLAAHAHAGRPDSSPLAVVAQPRLAAHYRATIVRGPSAPGAAHVGPTAPAEVDVDTTGRR